MLKRLLTQRRLPAKSEAGQVLILMVLGLTVIFFVAAVVIDMSFWLSERRGIQRAADLAVLAGVQELPEDDAAAILRSHEWAVKNGYTDGIDGIQVTVEALCKNTDPDSPIALCVNPAGPEPVSCSGSGCDSLRVVISKPAKLFFAEMFGLNSFTIQGGASARCEGCGPDDDSSPGGGAPQSPHVEVPRNLDCGVGDPVVDGRVVGSDEGYAKIGTLVSSTTSVDYGDAFAACDADYYYFALRLNGPSTGGAVANENVYAGCKASEIRYRSGDIDKIKGTVTSIGAFSFTVEAEAQVVTVDVDGNTRYRGNLNDFGDLAIGMAVEVKVETELGPLYVLAKEVKDKRDVFCTASSNTTYHSDYNTGWDDNAHTFGKLWGSDRARFQINCDGVAVHDFVQDYLRKEGTDWVSDAAGDGEVIVAGPNQSASSLEFNLENPDITGWGDDPGEDPLAQSPPFDGEYPNYDPEYDGFVWEMLYEFRIPISDYSGCGQIIFGLEDFGGSAGPLSGLHSSPAKTADGVFVAIVPTRVRLVE